jgi:hypothetical protein
MKMAKSEINGIKAKIMKIMAKANININNNQLINNNNQ